MYQDHIIVRIILNPVSAFTAWLIGTHYDHLPFLQMKRFAGEDDFCFTIKYINEGIRWRRAFT